MEIFQVDKATFDPQNHMVYTLPTISPTSDRGVGPGEVKVSLMHETQVRPRSVCGMVSSSPHGRWIFVPYPMLDSQLL